MSAFFYYSKCQCTGVVCKCYIFNWPTTTASSTIATSIREIKQHVAPAVWRWFDVFRTLSAPLAPASNLLPTRLWRPLLGFSVAQAARRKRRRSVIALRRS